jgi:RNA polymerase primary sigma factor
MPVHIVERLQKMNRAERTLWTQLGREPTLEEIAEEASLPLQQALEVKRPRGRRVARPARRRAGGRGVRRLRRRRRPLPEEEVEVSLRSQALTPRCGAARARAAGAVPALRLDDSEPKTLEEIGRRLGLTRERVRQIELESLRRLASLREMQSVTA